MHEKLTLTQVPDFTICSTAGSFVNKFAKDPKDDPKITAKAPPVTIPIWEELEKRESKPC